MNYKKHVIHDLGFHLSLEHLMVAQTAEEASLNSEILISFVQDIEQENEFNFGDEFDLEKIRLDLEYALQQLEKKIEEMYKKMDSLEEGQDSAVLDLRER